MHMGGPQRAVDPAMYDHIAGDNFAFDGARSRNVANSGADRAPDLTFDMEFAAGLDIAVKAAICADIGWLRLFLLVVVADGLALAEKHLGIFLLWPDAAESPLRYILHVVMSWPNGRRVGNTRYDRFM